MLYLCLRRCLEVCFFFFPPGKLNSTWQLPQQPIFVIYRIREQTRCRLSVNKFLLSLKVATYAVSFGQFINFCGVLFSSVLFQMLSLGISILFLGCIISKFRTWFKLEQLGVRIIEGCCCEMKVIWHQFCHFSAYWHRDSLVYHMEKNQINLWRVILKVPWLLYLEIHIFSPQRWVHFLSPWFLCCANQNCSVLGAFGSH